MSADQPDATLEEGRTPLDVISLADAAQRKDAEFLAFFRAVQEAARQIKVTVEQDDEGHLLHFDASALDDGGIVHWFICPKHDDPSLWHHPQSHADQWFPLSDVLLGIASVYVEPPRQRGRRHVVARTDQP